MAPILLQFFHEVEETEYWMETIMSRMHLAFHNNKLKGDKDNINVIDGEMKVSVHCKVANLCLLVLPADSICKQLRTDQAHAWIQRGDRGSGPP